MREASLINNVDVFEEGRTHFQTAPPPNTHTLVFLLAVSGSLALLRTDRIALFI